MTTSYIAGNVVKLALTGGIYADLTRGMKVGPLLVVAVIAAVPGGGVPPYGAAQTLLVQPCVLDVKEGALPYGQRFSIDASQVEEWASAPVIMARTSGTLVAGVAHLDAPAGYVKMKGDSWLIARASGSTKPGVTTAVYNDATGKVDVTSTEATDDGDLDVYLVRESWTPA